MGRQTYLKPVATITLLPSQATMTSASTKTRFLPEQDRRLSRPQE